MAAETIEMTNADTAAPVEQLKENSTLQGRLTGTQTELDDTAQRLKDLESQLHQQREDFNRARVAQQNNYISECDSLKSDIASLTAELTRLQNALRADNSATPDGTPPPPQGNNYSGTGNGSITTVDGVINNRKIQRVFKIVLVGDSGVGKTTFIRNLCLGEKATTASSTVGVDFYTKLMTVHGQCTSLKIWDTAGTERFRSITRSYFRGANGVILMYDAVDAKSFSHVRQWMGDVLESAEDSVIVMLVGNKSDLVAEQTTDANTTRDHGRTLADSYRALYAAVSARTGNGVVDAVAMMVRTMQDVEDECIQRAIKANIELDNAAEASKPGCC